MKHSKQMSESVRLGILLALSGGLMDAYSYIVRDRVFANAQTGNMLLICQREIFVWQYIILFLLLRLRSALR